MLLPFEGLSRCLAA
jgi:hypothetical protein